MLKTMTARFASKCSATGARINRGDTIEYDTVAKTARLLGAGDAPASGQGARVNTVSFGSEGRYKTYTRNVRGLCEDAPCCGCCTI